MKADEVPSNWADDLLQRKRFADFLTQYIEHRAQRDSTGLVVAIDAPWGAGKTFFIERWVRDLKGANRAVVIFDAWKNDAATDPPVAFMAELRVELSKFRGKLPKGASSKEKFDKINREAVGHLRRAVVPTLAVLGKGLLKKSLSVGYEELAEAVTGAVEEKEALDKLSEAAPEAVENGLDKFFEKSLEGHLARAQSVAAFRQSLSMLVSLLSETGVTKGPLFVFVDELDRCRPDYAIRLLEGIKHLFNVPGVVFVASTNLEQLSKAVGAVYGANFSGFDYLKRFFDFEYQLPVPDRLLFIQMQLQSTAIDESSGYTGLDTNLPKEKKTIAHAFQHIADAFSLDLRSIQRALTIVDAATVAAPAGTRFIWIWLFFLAVLRYRNANAFNDIHERRLTGPEFGTLMLDLVPRRPKVPAFVRMPNERPYLSSAYLDDLLKIFYVMSRGGRGMIEDARGQENRYNYPESVKAIVVDQWPSMNEQEPREMQLHSALIATAGHLDA